MRVLITGGTGFIGRALCEALLARRHQVTVLTRDPGAAQRVLPLAATAVQHLKLIGAVDGVINLAGENVMASRWTPQRKQRLMDSRVGVTGQLIDWMRNAPSRPKTLISGSAIGYYGDCGDTAVDENAAPADDFAAGLCAAWEAEAGRAVALGLRVCRVRIGVVLERDGGALAEMLMPFKLGLGGPIGSGRQWFSWIHRADLVALLIRLLEDPQAQGAYNGTAPQAVRNAEFAQALGRALHRPAFMPTPPAVLRLALGERAQMLLTGQQVIPARTQALGFDYQYPTIESAMAAIFPPKVA
jgi:uncharacterized protein (TIGR01777 family)